MQSEIPPMYPPGWPWPTPNVIIRNAAEQCNHCWCERAVHPDHARCCKCGDTMHDQFILDSRKSLMRALRLTGAGPAGEPDAPEGLQRRIDRLIDEKFAAQSARAREETEEGTR